MFTPFFSLAQFHAAGAAGIQLHPFVGVRMDTSLPEMTGAADGLPLLADAFGIAPCVLDAAIFSSFDGHRWTEQDVVWYPVESASFDWLLSHTTESKSPEESSVMKSPPLILSSLDDVGRRLSRIEVTPGDPRNEAWLQELLYSHPQLLPVEEFGDSFSPPIPIGREVGTARGPIDNLFVSPTGGITVVETKLWKNPEKHRTVVAQVIDYAKELATWDYDRLCEGILASSRRKGETRKASLEEKVAASLITSGVSLHDFQEGVAATLSGGNFLLLIVGDRISPNIALLTQAIQSAPGLGFTLGLAEMQLYQTVPGQDWPLLVIPEVLGRTVEQTRGVVRVQYVQERPQVTVEVEDDDEEDGPKGKIDLEQFLSSIPSDWREPILQGISDWESLGGRIHFTDRSLNFEMLLSGNFQRIVRCRSHQVSIVRPEELARWGKGTSSTEQYLKSLESSSVLAGHARNNKMWIRTKSLNSADLATLLRAARELVQHIRAEE